MKVEYKSFETEQQWLDFRKGFVSSTESGALFGVLPYLTEFELYHGKASGVTVDFKSNDRIELGNYLEDGIARFAADKLGIEVAPFKDYAYCLDSRMGSSFDYKVISGPKSDWPVEIKNVDYLRYRDTWTNDEPPFHIIVQVQHQLHMTKADGAIIACLVGGNDLKTIEMRRDQELGDLIESKVRTFWSNVDKGIEPDPDFERDSDIIKELYRGSIEGKPITVTPRIEELANLHTELSATKSATEKAMKATKSELLTIFGEAEVCKWSGGKVTLKPNKHGNRGINVSLK